MLNMKESILRTSLVTAMGLTAVVGCASNDSDDNRFASNCDASTINQLNVLDEKLTNAIHKENVLWDPAEAVVIKSELEDAVNNCDPQTSSTLIVRAEREVSEYERAEAEAEKQREEERIAQQRAQEENERYLAMAEKEWEQVETYDNLTEEQSEMKSEGRSALEDDKGRESYNILSSLNADLRERVEEYVVKKGDTLWDIASRSQTYDNPWQWPAIHDENREKIDDPDLIYPGQTLMIDKNAQPTELTAQARKNDLIR